MCTESQKAALPFSFVDDCVLFLKDLKDTSPDCQNAKLSVVVDFKNVDLVKENELQLKLEEQIRNIRIEVIEKESINRLLKEKKPVLGIVSSERNEPSFVYGSSSIKLWANHVGDKFPYRNVTFCRLDTR